MKLNNSACEIDEGLVRARGDSGIRIQYPLS
jgi:hypothetical protein